MKFCELRLTSGRNQDKLLHFKVNVRINKYSNLLLKTNLHSREFIFNLKHFFVIFVARVLAALSASVHIVDEICAKN